MSGADGASTEGHPTAPGRVAWRGVARRSDRRSLGTAYAVCARRKLARCERLHSDIFGGPRSGGLGLLCDLQDLDVMAAEVDIVWTLVGQAAQGARDDELFAVVSACEGETAMQLKWLRTRLKQAAPQALVVA